ncbi:MAG: hypothetical protein ACHQM6_10890 [Candidatus Kapaibacterium sp.]
MPSSSRLQNVACAIIFSFATLLFLMQTIDFVNFTVDDVFITLRISDNVAHGQGFVYNPGDRVEGYSNWLWVVLLSIPVVAGVSRSSSPFELLWIAKGLGLFFGIATLSTLFFLTKNAAGSSPRRSLLASIAVLFAASCAMFVQWSIGGLETTLCAFLYLFAALQAWHIFEERPPRSARLFLFGTSLALSCLVRPEPILFSGLAFLFVFRFGGKRFSLKTMSAALVPFLAIVGTFILWRWNYYDSVVPNTFYAKTSNGLSSYFLGIKYAFGAVLAIGGPLLGIIPLVFLQKTTKINLYALLMIGTTFLFTCYSAGDWMPGYRFFIPVASFFFLIAAMGIEKSYGHFLDKLSTVKHYVSLLVILLVIACSTVFFGRTFLRGQMPALATGFSVHKGYMLDVRDSVVQWFNSHTTKPFSVVTGEAGYLGYYSPNLQIIDVNGLFDKTIARAIKHRAPVDPDYFFGKKPDFVLLFGVNIHSQSITDNSPSSVYLFSLIHDVRFLQQYREVKTFPGFEIFARIDNAGVMK